MAKVPLGLDLGELCWESHSRAFGSKNPQQHLGVRWSFQKQGALKRPQYAAIASCKDSQKGP